MFEWRWGWLLLLTSTTTLVCCVLPIVLVSLGLGAVAAALYGQWPLLSFLGSHKTPTFAITALLLTIAAWALFRPGRTCPTDPALAGHCRTVDRLNRHLFWLSLMAWCGGFFAAYLLLPLARWLGYF